MVTDPISPSRRTRFVLHWPGGDGCMKAARLPKVANEPGPAGIEPAALRSGVLGSPLRTVNFEFAECRPVPRFATAFRSNCCPSPCAWLSRFRQALLRTRAAPGSGRKRRGQARPGPMGMVPFLSRRRPGRLECPIRSDRPSRMWRCRGCCHSFRCCPTWCRTAWSCCRTGRRPSRSSRHPRGQRLTR